MRLSRFVLCKVCGLHACMGIVSICIIIIIAIDKDIETKPNDVYGLIDGELYSICYS